MRRVVPLNNNWIFCDGFENSYLEPDFSWDGVGENVNLPHSCQPIDKTYFDESSLKRISTYSKVIPLPKSFNGAKLMLKFEGVLNYAEVYLNGAFVASHKGDTPFVADITAPAIYNYDNRVVVKIDSSIRSDVFSLGLAGPMITYGGIHRNVNLEILNGEIIENVFIKTDNETEDEKTVEIDVDLMDFYPDSSLSAEIFDGEGRLVGNLPEKTVLGVRTTLKGFIRDAKTWDTENPVLYTAKISLFKGRKEADFLEEKFGFRRAEFKNGGFYLNGKLTKLIGLNRLDSYAFFGRAMPSQMQINDVKILRQKLGVNVVRTHSLASRDFINECSRLGLLVICDISGDGYLGKRQWRESLLDNITSMVKRDRNQPCVIAWGVRINNSRDYNELYFKTNMAAKQADPTRSTLGARNFMASSMFEDIFGYNDYNYKGTLSKVAKTGKLFVPYIITEHTGKTFPSKPFDCEKIRLEHALRHLRTIDKALGSKKICGAIGMSFADFNSARSKGSGDNINYYGVCDIFRNPKLAFYAYASQFSSEHILKLSSDLSPDEYSGRFYAFTNCDFIKLYRDSEEIGDFYPNKKQFKNLPHAPICIDNFAGNLKKQEGMSIIESKIFKRLLRSIEKRDIFNLGFFDRFLGAVFRLRKKMSYDDFRQLAEKYSLDPKIPVVYRAVGYKKGEPVIESFAGGARLKKHIINFKKRIPINNGSYEVSRIDITAVDEFKNTLPFDFEPIEVKAEGSIAIVGDQRFSLCGGNGSIYFKNVGVGQGIIEITFRDSSKKIITVNVDEYEINLKMRSI